MPRCGQGIRPNQDRYISRPQIHWVNQGQPGVRGLIQQFAWGLRIEIHDEGHVNDYISLVIPRSKKDLNHMTNTTMHGMHSMFLASTVDSDDPILEKKTKKKDGQWKVKKGILGWTFEGV